MREYDVFGHKLSKMRPFYFIIALFIIIIPLHFVINFFQTQALNDLKDEYQSLRVELNALLNDDSIDGDMIHMGMIYTGFENDGFNIFIEDRIETLMYASDLGMPISLDINIQNDVASPFDTPLPEDITSNKIHMVIEVTDMDDVIDFLDTLIQQDKLYHIDGLQYTLLTNGDYRVTIDVYSFYI